MKHLILVLLGFKHRQGSSTKIHHIRHLAVAQSHNVSDHFEIAAQRILERSSRQYAPCYNCVSRQFLLVC